ncbi:MAG: ribulose-phosphate 3-epimerase [Coprococcus sp.]|nr:ribulose-phosphate 3-epimerase [Coprococcus sp.]
MMILSPSLLSVDFAHIADGIKLLEKAGVPALHLDVMDGAFVPNISFGAPVIKCLRKETDMIFDVHLMIEEPARYLEDFKAAGADWVTVHAESCKHLHSTVDKIKKLGMKAGVALNPATPVSVLDYVIDDLDMVLVMSVNPGFGGQSFIPSALRKIEEVRKMADERGLELNVEVDGGVNLNNVADVIVAGANVIVAGSAVFGGDAYENSRSFLKIMNR